MKITIFNEFHPDQKKGKAIKLYPNGIHTEIKLFLKDNPDFEVNIATQETPSHGLTDSILNETDVLIWWSDSWNEQILSDVAEKVNSRVLEGMGIIFLYGGCLSKPFKKLMGTSCNIAKSLNLESCKVTSVLPYHEISNNIPSSFVFSEEKNLFEPFDIPIPDELIFINGYSSGNILRSGCSYFRGKGKIFYFYGGSELSNAYQNKSVKQIILNAINWVSPHKTIEMPVAPSPLKDPDKKKKSFLFHK